MGWEPRLHEGRDGGNLELHVPGWGGLGRSASPTKEADRFLSICRGLGEMWLWQRNLLPRVHCTLAACLSTWL